MKMLKTLTALAALTAGAAYADTYKLDPVHTQVFFTVNHLGFSNSTGAFHIASGAVNFDGKDWSKASVQTSINTSTLDLGDATWKEHVSGERYLDVAKFPTIEFKSTKVEVVKDNELRVHGDLTLHGVTKAVVLDTRVNKTGTHPMSKQPAAGFSATTRIKRSEFGITSLLPMISDEVEIRIEVEAQVPKA